MNSTFFLASMLAATPQKAIGITILSVALLLWLGFVIAENRRTAASNVESFLNAPNRKAPPDDENYEGPRLDRWLTWALVGMAIMAVSLPAYFLAEPGRQKGALFGFDKRSVHRGEVNFSAEGLNCAQCHGPNGGGGVASFSVAQYNADGTPKIDPATKKQEIKQVSWTAPRINDVGLRYKEGQIRNVLIYGRGANKPMPAWGLAGGGPANEQQIDDLVNWLKHESIKENKVALETYESEWETNGHNADKAYEKAFEKVREERYEEAEKGLASQRAAAKTLLSTSKADLAKAEKAVADAEAKGEEGELYAARLALTTLNKNIDAATKTIAAKDGELLFNSNCARCHTNGYSYGEPKTSGGGFYGPALTEKSLKAQFPEAVAQHDFIKNGADDQKAYGVGGVNHWSGGGMPYFANILSDEQIDAIVEYERSL